MKATKKTSTQSNFNHMKATKLNSTQGNWSSEWQLAPKATQPMTSTQSSIKAPNEISTQGNLWYESKKWDKQLRQLNLWRQPRRLGASLHRQLIIWKQLNWIAAMKVRTVTSTHGNSTSYEISRRQPKQWKYLMRLAARATHFLKATKLNSTQGNWSCESKYPRQLKPMKAIKKTSTQSNLIIWKQLNWIAPKETDPLKATQPSWQPRRLTPKATSHMKATKLNSTQGNWSSEKQLAPKAYDASTYDGNQED